MFIVRTSSYVFAFFLYNSVNSYPDDTCSVLKLFHCSGISLILRVGTQCLWLFWPWWS